MTITLAGYDVLVPNTAYVRTGHRDQDTGEIVQEVVVLSLLRGLTGENIAQRILEEAKEFSEGNAEDTGPESLASNIAVLQQQVNQSYDALIREDKVVLRRLLDAANMVLSAPKITPDFVDVEYGAVLPAQISYHAPQSYEDAMKMVNDIPDRYIMTDMTMVEKMDYLKDFFDTMGMQTSDKLLEWIATRNDSFPFGCPIGKLGEFIIPVVGEQFASGEQSYLQIDKNDPFVKKGFVDQLAKVVTEGLEGKLSMLHDRSGVVFEGLARNTASIFVGTEISKSRLNP